MGGPSLEKRMGAASDVETGSAEGNRAATVERALTLCTTHVAF
jgi:hypothetical protein